MPLADSNVWLALALSKHVFHGAAQAWLAKQAPGEALFCRSTQQSFLRLLTTAAVFAPYGIPPLSNKAAWSVYEGFLADERIAWVEEPRGLEASWKKLASSPKASPKLWTAETPNLYNAIFSLKQNGKIIHQIQQRFGFRTMEVRDGDGL